MRACKDTPSPRARVADATRSCEEHAPPLAQRGFLTPLPATLQVVSPVMRQARQGATGQPVDPNTRYQPRRRCHAGMVQRWVVVYAQAALDRAEATLKHAPHRAHAAMTKQLLHLQAPRLGAPEAAHDARAALAQRWQYPRVEAAPLTAHRRYGGTGRPTSSPPRKAIAWHIQAKSLPRPRR